VIATRWGRPARAFVLLLLLFGARQAQAQSAVDATLSFYAHGGAYCFRIAPFGTALAEEREWTVMVLTSAANHQKTFRIRSVDPGDTGLRGAVLTTAGELANDVWKFDGTRAEFFERFAEGIRSGELRARVVKLNPPALARATSESQRAELYLDFADKGSRVSFDKVPDLSAEQFLQYGEYFPD
jgi:hypothetical protein